MALRPFHLAFPVRDLAEARAFYGGLLACPEGRSSESWVDFDFFGHQIVAHLSPGGGAEATNEVDGEAIPVRHFGVVLPWEEFPAMEKRLRERGIAFLVEPQIRFRGKPGEQATMFLKDPSGNALEFKAFRDPRKLFAR
ncbi:MAG TPA: VOC family protein [Planctomycetota bacterium]|nr:VOC family protein [Planctomycetota bacterium]